MNLSPSLRAPIMMFGDFSPLLIAPRLQFSKSDQIIKQNTKTSLLFCLLGDTPSDRPSDGAEDESAPLQPSQHAARGSAAQQIIAS